MNSPCVPQAFHRAKGIPALAACLAVILSACISCGGGGSSSSSPSNTALPNPPSADVPTLRAEPQSTTVSVGQVASFSVTASGAELRYQWKRNDVPVEGATGAVYTTPATTPADNNARLAVTVSNAQGNTSSHEAILTVISNPGIGGPSSPSTLRGQAVSSTQINLAWDDNSANETGFRIQRDSGSGFTTRATVPANTTSYQDTGLAPSTSYSYRITAYNEANESSPSTVLTISSQPQVRGFLLFMSLSSDAQLASAKAVVSDAMAQGFNTVFHGSDSYGLPIFLSQAGKDRVKAFKAFCDERRVAIIPLCWSPGYMGSTLYWHPETRGFVTAYPASVKFRISNGVATIIPENDSASFLENFENYSNNHFSSLAQDIEGVCSFLDTTTSFSGTKSVRLENFQANHNMGRLRKRVKVVPRTSYEFSVSARADADFLKAGKAMRLQVFRADSASCLSTLQLTPTATWKTYKIQFNSCDETQLDLWAGAWGALAGKIWIDDFQVKRQDTFQMLVQRPTTPVTVRNASTGAEYAAGVDYVIGGSPTYPEYLYTFTPIGNRLDGATVEVSHHRSYWTKSWGEQMSFSMDAAGVQDFLDAQTDLSNELFSSPGYHLACDEIRQGGYDPETTDSISSALIRHLNRRVAKIRQLNSNATIYMWADMILPSQNAVSPYFATKGGFSEILGSVNKTVKPIVWSYDTRDAALTTLLGSGFDVGVSIDVGECNDTSKLNEWKASLANVGLQKPGTIIYTTWTGDYSRLTEFARVFF